MVLLTAENIKKSYTEKPLLEDISFTINEGDKIGLIGVNGTGKSTLLKITAGTVDEEDGKIIRARELRCGYLPQNPQYNPEFTIMQQADEYKNAYGAGFHDFEFRSVLTKLGITDFEQKMGELSGGQRKRVALAAVLAQDTNLLILDEPTNHMDEDIIKWMEERLRKYKGAIFMITHDRYFLDRVTNKIFEVDKGKLYSYDGNYDYYLELKAAREESMIASERKRRAIYKKELAWIRRGAQARTTKAKGRIDRFHELENSRLVIDDSRLEISSASSRMGKKVIELENISKSYDDRMLINDFSYILLRRDRVGVIGPNGCGKSTLLKIITRQLEPDTGTVETGETVKIGYFAQENQALDDDKRIIRFISDIAENVKTDDGYFSASQMLERFLFPPYMHSVKVGALSGGEKRRLYLLSILMQAPNVLILDEPTNDLDIETLTILEDYLDDFQGAVIAVSHDRYFLDRVCERTLAFRDGGEIRLYNGGYSDFDAARTEEEKQLKALRKKSAEKAETAKAQDNVDDLKVQGKEVGASENTASKASQKAKFTFNEKYEFEHIDEEIEKLEKAIEDKEKEIKDNPTAYSMLATLMEEKDELELQLLEKMERWEYLNEINERIKQQRNGK